MKNKKDLKIILFYGIIWGLLEFILGGYLHFINYPFNELIMRIIGFGILAVYAFRSNSSYNLLGIGVIAASFKIFNVFTCNISIYSSGIINPIISILVQTLIVNIITFGVIRVNNLVLLNTENKKTLKK